MEKKWWSLLLASSLIINGCGLYTSNEVIDIPDVVVNQTLSSEITEALKQAPKEDCIKIYTFFTGLSRYITNLTNEDITTDRVLNEILLNAQNNYGWQRDKYTELSNAISKDLTNKKLNEPHKLNDLTGQEKISVLLVRALDEYASIVKTVIESK